MRRFGIASGLVLSFLVGCAGSSDGSVGAGPEQDINASGGSTNADGTPATNAPAPAAPRTVKVLANIGDSISQGYDADDSIPVDLDEAAKNADQVFHDNTPYSWIQGTDDRVSSIAAHYRSLNPSLIVTPYSVSGAELVGKPFQKPTLVDQATSLVAASQHPDLVYWLLGGNDICNRPKADGNDATATLYPVTQWTAEIDKGLAILAQGLDAGVTVRVLSMPRVDRLYEHAGDARFAAKYAFMNTSLSCKQFWMATAMMGQGVCSILTTEPDASRRAAIGERIDAYNDALAAEVRRFSSDKALNPKGIVFQSDWHGAIGKGGTENGSMGTFAFESELVSKRDCFHPSIKGQAAISNLVLNTAKWE